MDEILMPQTATSIRLVKTPAGLVPPSVAAETATEHIRKVLALPSRPARAGQKAFEVAGRIIAVVVPPLIVVALALLIWELASSGPKATLQIGRAHV